MAILRGFLWDNGLSILGAVLVASWLASEAAGDPDQADAVLASATFAIWFLPIGIACTVYGGYVAGRAASSAHLKNGVAVGCADVAFGLLGLLLPSHGPPPPLWADLAGFGLVIPAAALGGWLAARAAADAGPGPEAPNP